MFVYPVYKAIKTRLNAIAPVFYFIGQYTKGKDNTSYKVPAIYIEMPKDGNLLFWGRKVVSSKGNIRIHYISNAPFKNHDNPVQDSAIVAHEASVAQIDKFIAGWNALDNDKLLTQELIPIAASMNNFVGENIVSVITYKTEIYSRHLRV